MNAPLSPLAIAAIFLALSGCAVGPNYTRPTVATPVAFKESDGWKTAAPADALDRGPWWQLFHDSQLDELERQAATANPSLRVAAANYEQARQLARADHATLFPTLTAGASAERARTGAGRNATGASSAAARSPGATANSFSATLGASWTPDFWGRVRRQTESDVATAQASAADLLSAQLSLQSTLAQNYLQLRVADERIRLRESAVTAYGRTLQIAQNKYNAGIVARNDVTSAQAQLDAARAQVIDAQLQRAQLEHAIAILVGQPPAGFTLSPQPALNVPLPAIPPQLPSTLLERRPDIAAAERRVAAANAKIGVQAAAYFPTLSLSAALGSESSQVVKLFSAPAALWSLGADVAGTLLDFGHRRAEVAAARAGYDASVATYHGTVLSAFREIEDQLASLHYLETEAQVQQAAVTAASEAARIALNEYNAGTVDYTTVVTAQVAELDDRQTALTILQTRLTAAVSLIEALGGDWRPDTLPSDHAVLAQTSPALKRTSPQLHP